MERKTLADYFLEGGVRGEQFITPQGEVYTCLGITPVSESETKNRKKRMRIQKAGSLEEHVDIDSHLADSRIAVDLAAGKFYESVLNEKVLFYDGKHLIDNSRNELDPSKEKGLRLIEDESKYLKALGEKASYLYEEKRRVEGISEFMRACLEKKPDAAYTSNGSDEMEDTAMEIFLSDLDEKGDLRLDNPDVTLEDTYYGPQKTPDINPLSSEDTDPDIPFDKMDEDINLDSFGSGSGLLDLSLQADDTSLGGILDEIYAEEDNAEKDKGITQVEPEPAEPKYNPSIKPKRKKNPLTRAWRWFLDF